MIERADQHARRVRWVIIAAAARVSFPPVAVGWVRKITKIPPTATLQHMGGLLHLH